MHIALRIVLAASGWLVASLLWSMPDNPGINPGLNAFINLSFFAFSTAIAIWFIINGPTPESVAANKAREIALNDLKYKVVNRFHGSVFIIPQKAKNNQVIHPKHWDSYNDENWESWRDMLDMYPHPPQSQREVAANEVTFWRYYSNHYTIKHNDGTYDLYPHADIVRYYKTDERWILRRYFAATGRVIEPAIQEELRICLNLEDVRNRQSVWDDETSIKATQERSDIERYKHELEQFQHHGKKAHFEKWGKWFVAHIEEQFKRDNKPKQPLPDEHFGSGGFATARDVNGRSDYRPSSGLTRSDRHEPDYYDDDGRHGRCVDLPGSQGFTIVDRNGRSILPPGRYRKLPGPRGSTITDENGRPLWHPI